MTYLIRFVKNWTLPCAMLLGVLGYFLFAQISLLAPAKPYLHGLSVFLTPMLIFLMLFFTFCKVDLPDLKPKRWHVWLLLLQTVACVGVAVYMMYGVPDGENRVIWEGALACLLCPTATAAAVVTGKLGGNAGSLTTYTLESNLLSAVLITVLCPLVHPHVELPMSLTFLVMLNKVTQLLILPFVAAWAVRRFLPALHARVLGLKDIAFYLWGIALALVMAQTTHTVLTSSASSFLEWKIGLVALLVCGLKFALGKWIGSFYGERISGGQALGQKNTIFAIWMAFTYLSPLSAIGPGAYVLWQNSINSYQLWKRRKQETMG